MDEVMFAKAVFVGAAIIIVVIAFVWCEWQLRKGDMKCDRRLSGLCSECGYDLRGTYAIDGHVFLKQCPECGERVQDLSREPLHRWIREQVPNA